MNTFHVDLLTVLGVLVAMGALLSLLSALDPTTQPRQRRTNAGTRENSARQAAPIVTAEAPVERAPRAA